MLKYNKTPNTRGFSIWARRDSNPRPRDYESPALPLRHSPTTVIFNYIEVIACGS